MNPFILIALLHNQRNEKYHPIIFRYSPLPGGCDIPRYKSNGHHTNGFVFREEAIAECFSMAVALTSRFTERIQTALGKDIEWDGESMPAISTLFVERDGHYEIVGEF
jgi:hypothetical protein